MFIAYSDFLDEEMTKPGPKYLPLGRSFQEHVALFKYDLDPFITNYEVFLNLFCSTSGVSNTLGNPKEKLLKQLE